VFWKSLAWYVPPFVPLIPLPTEDLHPGPSISTKAILLVFSICTIVDFAFGYIHKRTISAGVISVFGGLFSTDVALLIVRLNVIGQIIDRIVDYAHCPRMIPAAASVTLDAPRLIARSEAKGW